MLSFREYVAAVGSSVRTVAARQFRESFAEALNDSKIVKLDKSGKYILNRWHQPRLNIITEGDVKGEWVSGVPPLDPRAWVGFRPAIKENIPNGELSVQLHVGIPINYNKEKYVVADEYRLSHAKQLRSDLKEKVILPARKMVAEAQQELDDANNLIDPDDQDTLKYGQHFKFLHFEFMYNFYEDPLTYERINYTGKDLSIVKSKRKKSLSDLKSAISNVERDISDLDKLLKFIENQGI